MRIEPAAPEDLATIRSEIAAFWGDERSGPLHHPILVHEFADAAFVARDGARIAGYLFGLWASAAPIGYVHLVAVRDSHRRRGIARALYERFEQEARRRGCAGLKAITHPGNAASIRFHRAMGFRLEGEPNEDGLAVVRNYRGPGQDRVVFRKAL